METVMTTRRRDVGNESRSFWREAWRRVAAKEMRQGGPITAGGEVK